MRSRKRLSVWVALAIILSIVAGCAGTTKKPDPTPAAPATAPEAKPEPVELRALWWGAQDRHDRTLKAIEAFSKKYPHITITSEFSGNDVYWDKLSVKAATGDAPDLIQMDFAYINEYAGRGALLDLTPFTGKELDLKEVDKNLIASGQVGGKLYGIALGSNSQALFVNKTMVEKAGLTVPAFTWTWADFEKFGKDFKAKAANDLWFSPDQSFERQIFEHWLRQNGSTGLWNGVKMNFTDKEVAEWWKLWDGYRKAGFVPGGEVSMANGGFNGPFDQSLWAKQKAVSHWGWSNEFERNAKLNPGETVMLPLPRGGKAEGAYPKASMYWSVFNKTKHPKEAALFVSWFINDPEAAKILSTTRGVPVTKSARDTLKTAGLSTYDTAVFEFVDKVNQFAGATPAAAPKGNTEFFKAMIRYAQEVAFGRKTMEVSAKEFITEATGILEKANQK